MQNISVYIILEDKRKYRDKKWNMELSMFSLLKLGGKAIDSGVFLGY